MIDLRHDYAFVLISFLFLLFFTKASFSFILTFLFFLSLSLFIFLSSASHIYTNMVLEGEREGKRLIFATWNACSVVNKKTEIEALLFQHKVDILSITETWLSDKYKVWEFFGYNIEQTEMLTVVVLFFW